MKHLPLRMALYAAVPLLVLAIMLSALSAQELNRRNVMVPVTVMRQLDGKAVIGLKAEDFAIQEDGIKQKVSSVELSRDQYVVIYAAAPNPNMGYRTITVTVNVPSVIVRARRGYFPR